MTNLFNKYLNQDRQKVWYQILALEKKELQNNEEDIRLIVEFFSKTTKQNCEIIYDFLKNSDYIFTTAGKGGTTVERNIILNPAYSADTSNYLSLMQKLEAETKDYGQIPLIFKAIYQQIGYADFEGEFPDFIYWEYKTENNDTINSPDPLQLIPLDIMDDLWWSHSNKSAVFEKDYNQYSMGFSGSDLDKTNTSSDGFGYRILLNKEPKLDDKIIGYRQKDLLFSDYLRMCFKWGGFPQIEFNAHNIPKKDETFQFIKKIAKELIPI